MRPSLALQGQREAIRKIVEENHAGNVRVFGSVLHGSDTEGSDLDLLVDPTSQTTLFDLARIQRRAQEILGVPVDVLTPKALPEKFRDSVLAEAVLLWRATRDALRIPDYLEHILNAIKRINDYTADMSEVDFLEDEKTQDAVIRNFEVIGEAAKNIERNHAEFAAMNPEIPWGDAYLLRNQVAHGYFKVDMEIVWRTIQHDLPSMEHDVRQLLNSISTP